MSAWERKVSLSHPHKCDLPDIAAEDAGPGSRWRCSCGTLWVVCLTPIAVLAQYGRPLDKLLITDLRWREEGAGPPPPP